MSRFYFLFFLICVGVSATSTAQNIRNNPASNHGNSFEQLGGILPTPNAFRAASGAPGHLYWQQKVDYKIDCQLDEKKTLLQGQETITYHNNSPDILTYLWIQLDENQHHPTKQSVFVSPMTIQSKMSTMGIDMVSKKNKKEAYGVNIVSITDPTGKALSYTVNHTMMRVDLPMPLAPHQKFVFHIRWNYVIPDRSKAVDARGGLEYFDKDGNYVFTMAQWYPRLCVYSDFQGWQNHQFTGRGEFALTFGDFDVNITVPDDHVVAATGECSNYNEVLSIKQLERFQQAHQSSTEPVEIVTLKEATAAEKGKPTGTKTWRYTARNVRDFAWTSSRKFIWDALYTPVEGRTEPVLCMSLYPKESYHLYRKYSTKVVAHTIRSYSHFTIPYPYPVAQSIEANNGMEYPMICFNYGRTEEDGTYSKGIKYGMIGVVIHEVGHNFFPMIVNSDERQWSWFDEGLNTFVQFLTEQLFENNYPSSRGPAYEIVNYMKLPANMLEPIMTNSENIIYFGANAYAKPATALNILRETVMGRTLFDFAFKEYARRWAFKHPQPADFFRTMEDASGVDLDWFWRGWFYDTKPVDISLDSVAVVAFDPSPVPQDTAKRRVVTHKPSEHLSMRRNRADKSIRFLVETDPSLNDFYTTYRPWETADSVQMVSAQKTFPLTKSEQEAYTKDSYYYTLFFTNKGGLVSPIIVEWNYADGSKEKEIVDAQVWRKNENNVAMTFVKPKSVASIRLDPDRETADINESNQSWASAGTAKSTPTKTSRFQIYKFSKLSRNASEAENPMQKAKKNKTK